MKSSIFKPNKEISKTRQLTITAVLGAMASALMFAEVSLPMFIPGFVKFDLSDLPALIAAFAVGPLSGVCVCLIKNLVNIAITYSGGIGELANFLIGCGLVIPAGLVYKMKKTRKTAIIGALLGSAVMALVSIPVNYFISYPFYTKFMEMSSIIKAYQALNPKVETLLDALVWFNMPFTFVKGICCTAVTVAIYKYISPVFKHGTADERQKASM
ncbi:MAG: ECF transporter S component [Oscillospiraceae bacterium]|nr:ECF transporter S component [Oscillospiraceae bacterium]